MNKIILTIITLFFLNNVIAQDFSNEIQRNIYIQNLENIDEEIELKNKIKFNTIFLDASMSADFKFILHTTNVENHKNFFLISNYTKETKFGDIVAPGCMIMIDYRNKINFYMHAKRYLDIMNEKESLNFVNYFLVSHELGHCIARDLLGVDVIDEKYADAIASHLLKSTKYKNYINVWISRLKLNQGNHNTYDYVNNFYEKTKEMNELNDVLNYLKNNK